MIDTLNENFHSSHVPEDLRDIAFQPDSSWSCRPAYKKSYFYSSMYKIKADTRKCLL